MTHFPFFSHRTHLTPLNLNKKKRHLRFFRSFRYPQNKTDKIQYVYYTKRLSVRVKCIGNERNISILMGTILSHFSGGYLTPEEGILIIPALTTFITMVVQISLSFIRIIIRDILWPAVAYNINQHNPDFHWVIGGVDSGPYIPPQSPPIFVSDFPHFSYRISDSTIRAFHLFDSTRHCLGPSHLITRIAPIDPTINLTHIIEVDNQHAITHAIAANGVRKNLVRLPIPLMLGSITLSARDFVFCSIKNDYLILGIIVVWKVTFLAQLLIKAQKKDI